MERILGLVMLAASLVVQAAWGSDLDAFRRWVDKLPPVSDVPLEEGGYRPRAELFRAIRAGLDAGNVDADAEWFGSSSGGRALWAFHVHGPPGDAPRRSVLIFAGIHALEWISSEVATDTLVGLLADPPPGVDVTVVPLLNPDGRARVEADLRSGENRYRRGNGRLVDLNRDFSVHREARSWWRKILPRRHGTTAASMSQPETKALDRLAARGTYDRAASLHAFGGYFYYPWTGRWKRPPHWKSFVALGRAMESAQGPNAYRTKQLARWAFFFRAQGTEIDHLYARYGTLAFLVELTRSGVNPARPKTFQQYFRWYNPVNRMRHVDKGVAAMRMLVVHPRVDGEDGVAPGPVDAPELATPTAAARP